jgi:dipeptide/tripeptide permease
VLGLTLATGGWLSNLIVYLIQEFHVESINAAQISNVVSGCSNLFPVIGAIVADSFISSFSVVSISACISLLVIFSPSYITCVFDCGRQFYVQNILKILIIIFSSQYLLYLEHP